MKRTLLLASLACATCTYGQLDVGLKAHWTFSGSTVDITGNGHDGTIDGVVTSTTDRNNQANCAFAFPGDTSHIAIPFGNDFDIAPGGAYTLSLWYQGGSIENGDLEWLFRKRNTPPLYVFWNYGLALYDLNKPIYFCGNDQQLWAENEPANPDLQWHNLVGVYADGTHQLWLDNVLIAADTSQVFFVTQSQQGCVIGEGFAGSIDDIRFYDRALDANEVGLLFAEASSCATAVDEVEAFSVSIAPNPASDVISIRTNTVLPVNMRTIELLDATGRSVRRMPLRASGGELDVRELIDGLYFLRIGTGDGAIVKKVVKD